MPTARLGFKHYLAALLLATITAAADDQWPAFPIANAAVEIPAQEWPAQPGPRKVRIVVHYPGRKLDNVDSQTGVMLTLHNWAALIARVPPIHRRWPIA